MSWASLPPRVGVTEVLIITFYGLDISAFTKVHVWSFEPHSYLTGVNAAMLWWHLSIGTWYSICSQRFDNMKKDKKKTKLNKKIKRGKKRDIENLLSNPHPRLFTVNPVRVRVIDSIAPWIRGRVWIIRCYIIQTCHEIPDKLKAPMNHQTRCNYHDGISALFL